MATVGILLFYPFPKRNARLIAKVNTRSRAAEGERSLYVFRARVKKTAELLTRVYISVFEHYAFLLRSASLRICDFKAGTYILYAFYIKDYDITKVISYARETMCSYMCWEKTKEKEKKFAFSADETNQYIFQYTKKNNLL